MNLWKYMKRRKNIFWWHCSADWRRTEGKTSIMKVEYVTNGSKAKDECWKTEIMSGGGCRRGNARG